MKSQSAQMVRRNKREKEKRPARTKKTQRALFGNLPPAVFTVSSFCVAHDLSESFYHKLKKLGLTPREMKIGDRRLISHEAAADWRREREAATSASAPPIAPSVDRRRHRPAGKHQHQQHDPEPSQLRAGLTPRSSSPRSSPSGPPEEAA